MKILGRLILATFVLLSFSTAMLAEDPDPPARVAELAYMSGSVSVQPHGADDWVGGTLNRPLTDSDNVWADKDSRAELNVGTGYLRIDSETSLTLTNISDNSVQVQLHQGALNVSVNHLFNGEIYEIDTPNMAFTVQKSGNYRFDVDPNSDTTLVTVWNGEGDATGEGPAVRLKAHESARFSNGTSMAYEMLPSPRPDGFDDWASVRDQRLEHSASARYVAPGTVGYQDLDQYGDWRDVPSYGPVWVPSHVASDWAPYRDGHWVWIDPWGWTWVDDAPWGFAPFHYGRWVYTGGYWGWAPGPYAVRPVYAPALVAWFGGNNWGVGVSFGGGYGYGWCPLGYGEPYIPWYRGSRGYFRNVNVSNTRITNITYVTNNYYGGKWHGRPIDHVNLNRPHAITAVPQRAIVNSTPVSRARVNVSPAQFRNASLHGQVDIKPDRTSRLGEAAGRKAALPPQRAFSRPVVTRNNAPKGGGANRGEANRGQVANRPANENQRQGNAAEAGRPTGDRAGSAPRPGEPNRNQPNAVGENRGPNNNNAARGANPNENRGNGNAERNVPRPPSARNSDNGSPDRNARQGENNPGGNNPGGNNNNRGGNNNETGPRSGANQTGTFSRPGEPNRPESTARPATPESPMRDAQRNNNQNQNQNSGRPGNADRAVPRPPEGGNRNADRPSTNNNERPGNPRGADHPSPPQRNESPRNNDRNNNNDKKPQGRGRASVNVPRPNGPVRPAGYTSAQRSGVNRRALMLREVLIRPRKTEMQTLRAIALRHNNGARRRIGRTRHTRRIRAGQIRAIRSGRIHSPRTRSRPTVTSRRHMGTALTAAHSHGRVRVRRIRLTAVRAPHIAARDLLTAHLLLLEDRFQLRGGAASADAAAAAVVVEAGVVTAAAVAAGDSFSGRNKNAAYGRRFCCDTMTIRGTGFQLSSASFFALTFTTVIFEKPSSNVGGFNFSAKRRITSSGTTRSRRRLRSRHTSTGTSKYTACTS